MLGNPDDIFAVKRLVDDTALTPEPGADPTVTLVEGRPGSGKTTLLWKLMHGWCRSSGRWSKQYDLVFVMILRTVQEMEAWLQLPLPDLLRAVCLRSSPDVDIGLLETAL